MKYNVEIHKRKFIEIEAEKFQELMKKVKKKYPGHLIYGWKITA